MVHPVVFGCLFREGSCRAFWKCGKPGNSKVTGHADTALFVFVILVVILDHLYLTSPQMKPLEALVLSSVHPISILVPGPSMP